MPAVAPQRLDGWMLRTTCKIFNRWGQVVFESNDHEEHWDGTQNGKDSIWKPTLLHTFDAPVWRVSWSVTGHMLAVSSGDNDVTLWKAKLDGSWTQMSTVEDTLTGQQQQQG